MTGETGDARPHLAASASASSCACTMRRSAGQSCEMQLTIVTAGPSGMPISSRSSPVMYLLPSPANERTCTDTKETAGGVR